MASRLDYVEFVMEQMAEAGTITCRPMFGEYGLYCGGKFFALICDDRLLIKLTPAGEALVPDCPRDIPYEGGSRMLLPDVEDRETLTELVRLTCASLPERADRRRNKKRGCSRTDGCAARQEKCAAEGAAMEKIDYKKTEKHLYLPKGAAIVEVPEMAFIAVDGQGDPNTSAAYREALELLYGLSFTIKMSKMGGGTPEGYFDYVVPPLEGLWWTDEPGFDGRGAVDKSRFRWVSMIRQPDFVTEPVFEWAKSILAKKKPGLDLSRARYWRWREGLCAHILHTGPYDAEPETIDRLERFIREQGYVTDLTDQRRHHEIYLGDPRRTAPERLRTVIRHPVRKRET